MELAILQRLNAARRDRVAAIILTDIATGQARLIREGEVLDENLAAVVQSAFQSGKSGRFCKPWMAAIS